jgi:beta-N-acetylhexosaminidase
MSDNLRDLVGQSLMLSFDGQRLTPALADLLARTCACGVILFARNIAGPVQLQELCAGLQAHAKAIGLPPLLIAIDQEGGTVSRLPAPFVVPPSQQAQAAAGPEAAYTAARITGAQLRACGVNVNFAPVLDVSLNPANPVIGTRGFGPGVATVSACGLAALRGYRETGVIATVKHFPGHGDTAVDSHHGLPVVAHDVARLEAVELAPFRAAFAAGAPALMVAHMLFPALDTEPATLSPTILRGLLRERMGYEGLVFTDALDMRAIADRHPAPEAAVLAKIAGADVALPLGDDANQIAVAEGLAAATADGRLAAEDLAATVGRLDRLRAAYGLGRDEPPAPPLAATLEAEALALARGGLTRRDPRGLLPLPADTRLAAIDCLLPRFNNAEEAASRSELLRGLLAAAFPALRYRALAPDAPDAEWVGALAAAEGADVVLLVTRNACFIERQVRLGLALAGRPTPLFHLAARSPHDVECLPGAAASLRTYGDPPLSLRAAVEALGGQGGWL